MFLIVCRTQLINWTLAEDENRASFTRVNIPAIEVESGYHLTVISHKYKQDSAYPGQCDDVRLTDNCFIILTTINKQNTMTQSEMP